MITPNNNIDSNKQIRIIVAGRGDELGTLFQLAALSKAEKYLNNYPQDQILILSAVENERKKNQEKQIFVNRKFQYVTEVPGSLGTDKFFDQILKYKKIASLDFFTHATVKFGLRLDRSEDRLESLDDWWKLKNKLTEEAYIFLHGCNTGFELAPALAKLIHRPVFGSLTSTYFQRLTQDRQFISSDSKGIKEDQWHVPSVYRLVPDTIPYNGHWGHFSGGGLGFFKAFCGDLIPSACFNGMQIMMKDWITSKNSYKEQVQDFLCSGRPDSALGKKCKNSLELRNFNLSTFIGNPLKCDFKSCEFELICPQFDDRCDLQNPFQGIETIHEEYRAFLNSSAPFPALTL
ncbi:MAG: hypothetical protein ACK5W9_01245 [Bdellovibrionales bacterium]